MFMHLSDWVLIKQNLMNFIYFADAKVKQFQVKSKFKLTTFYTELIDFVIKIK